MISKCANPQCSRQLLRLEGGKFFGFAKDKSIEHFWLCASCARQFTLQLVEGQVKLLRRERKSA
jgi:hypothetical protein